MGRFPIFSINTNGTGFTNLLSFSGTNGWNPLGSLTLNGSTLFGMTGNGSYGNGTIFHINTDGSGFQTVLQLRTGAEITVVFCAFADRGQTAHGVCLLLFLRHLLMRRS